jgi:hypothetical protein
MTIAGCRELISQSPIILQFSIFIPPSIPYCHLLLGSIEKKATAHLNWIVWNTVFCLWWSVNHELDETYILWLRRIIVIADQSTLHIIATRLPISTTPLALVRGLNISWMPLIDSRDVPVKQSFRNAWAIVDSSNYRSVLNIFIATYLPLPEIIC